RVYHQENPRKCRMRNYAGYRRRSPGVLCGARRGCIGEHFCPADGRECAKDSPMDWTVYRTTPLGI
ncbi:hypothetical protein IWQ62_005393, partial [Dispira parvispora]